MFGGSAPDDLQDAADAYAAAIEAEVSVPSGDGEVDAAAIAESMETIERGRGPAAADLLAAIRDDCDVDDVTL